VSLTAMNVMLLSASNKCCDLYRFHAVVFASFALRHCYRLFSLYKNVGIFYLDVSFCLFFSNFAPKICMWLLFLTHGTCQFGPIDNCRVKNANREVGYCTASHNHCLTCQILLCTHFSHTTGVIPL